MSTLASFFHGHDTHLGTFYPTHYVLAVYPSLKDAEEARRQLVAAGFPGDEVIAVPGGDMLRLCAEHVVKDGLTGAVMRKLSRIFVTEVPYSDRDVKFAEQGAGFLAVHCRDERVKERAWGHLQLTEPLAARYYAPSGLEHLVGEV